MVGTGVELLFGPLLIGLLLSTATYGVMCIQMFLYYQTFKKWSPNVMHGQSAYSCYSGMPLGFDTLCYTCSLPIRPTLFSKSGLYTNH
ncbi:hypothetical protein C8R43DRAFT_49393 [Mycena crocata]|nr:hypothetical protein C8R43DRAFT_49393 [Mycena crocata]